MTTVREVVDLPGMPGPVRFALTLMSAIFLRLAAEFGGPMTETGWTWGHGISTIVALLLAVDLVHSAARKRWPLVLFLDLFLARIVTVRSQ